MYRTSIAAFFLALAVMPACGFLLLEVKQRMVQHEMMEKLERAQLETLRIPANQVYWYKKNKEILVNNQLFDVKSFKVVNGVAEVKGLFDEKETAIKKSLAAAGSHNQQTGKLAGQFISLLLYNQFDELQSPLVPVTACMQHFFSTLFILKSLSPDLLTPPPRF